MKKSQQGVAIAICSIGFIVLVVGGAVLVSQLMEERTARRAAEDERDQLLERVKLLEDRSASLRKIRFKRLAMPQFIDGSSSTEIVEFLTGVPETGVGETSSERKETDLRSRNDGGPR